MKKIVNDVTIFKEFIKQILEEKYNYSLLLSDKNLTLFDKKVISSNKKRINIQIYGDDNFTGIEFYDTLGNVIKIQPISEITKGSSKKVDGLIIIEDKEAIIFEIKQAGDSEFKKGIEQLKSIKKYLNNKLPNLKITEVHIIGRVTLPKNYITVNHQLYKKDTKGRKSPANVFGDGTPLYIYI